MAAGDKIGRIVFRKIGGKIVPIRIKNVADKAASTPFVKVRNIVAQSDEFGNMGKLTLSIPKKGNNATLDSVMVPEQFRKKGISKNLFRRATDFLVRANKRFLRSTDMQHVAQAKIRYQYGGTYLTDPITKMGKKRTKFFADQFGPFGEETRRISYSKAISIIAKNNSERGNGQLVTATTMLKKIKRLKKSNQSR